MSAGDLVTRIYSGFRGVDFRGDEINLVRSPDSLNMWKDYKETDSIRTRPKMEQVKLYALISKTDPETETETKTVEPLIGTVYGYHFFLRRNELLEFIHCGNALYRIMYPYKDGFYLMRMGGDSVQINEAPSQSFILNDRLYIKDGKDFIIWTQEEGMILLTDDYTEIGENSEYDLRHIPTTSIAREPSGRGGKIHEEVNMLTEKRKNTFLADGISTEYFLDAQNLDESRVVVKVNGVTIREYTVDYIAGKITFDEPPPVPLTDGQDNVEITFRKTVPGSEEKIKECTILQVFDNRVFYSGNPKYPNMIWYSALDDPLYVSDRDYNKEGFDTSAVKGMVAGNNALWVLKEPSPANTSLFYHTPTTDYEYGKIYPNTHSNISTGCIGKAINFNDDIVFFSERGMEGINADVTKEQVIAHRSTLVDRKLLAEPNYKNMILAEWEGYLLVFIDNKVYLADSRAMFTNENHVEYEWFYWELDKKITCASTHDGILYLGTEEGLYTLTDTTSDVESYWVTPLDKFKHPQYMKTTNKRGCVTEAKGDISLYVKTNKTDFELIVEHKDVKDSFISRIKRKKFKDIQLKFYSTTRFSLEASTLECFVGGYLKR